MTPFITGRRIVGFFVLLLLASFLSACSTFQTGSHYDGTTNFGAFESFSWIDDEPHISVADSILISSLDQ